MFRRLAQTGCLVLLTLLLTGWEVASANACPNEAIRPTLHSAGLPDCRAYELVSSGSKYGWPLAVLHVSSNGGRAVAQSLGTFQDSEQAYIFNFYEFVREAGHWKTSPLNAPTGYSIALDGSSPLGAESPDLTEDIFDYQPSSVTDQRNTGFYARAIPGGPSVEIGPRISPKGLESTSLHETLNSSPPGASSDLSRVLYMLNGPEEVLGGKVNYVWPGDETAARQRGVGWTSLYEYLGRGASAPTLVGVNDSGRMIGECGTTLGYPEAGLFSSLYGEDLFNAISAPKGSRVFFTVAAGPCEGGGIGPAANELYASEETSPGVRHAVAISEPSTGPGGDCALCAATAPRSAVFQGASEDGSKVFFLSEQQLLHGAEGVNLYEYDFNAASGTKVRLVAPEVQGVARISEDGSHVYFVAETKLTSTANPNEDVAHLGAYNLYVYDTETGETSFVGDLSSGDSADWQTRDERPVDASRNGQVLVFDSSADLTHSGTGGVSQVFEYDAAAKNLVLVSRSQGGAGGTSPASVVYPRYTGSFDPSPQGSSVSDDGSVVVFESEAALTTHALVGYDNVYEYHGGVLSLISDGQDRSHRDGGLSSVSLVGVDGSGQDIFFTTADRLVPQDGDTQEDVYDARVDGGFLPSTAPECRGEGCQGPLAPSLPEVIPNSFAQTAGEQAGEPPAAKTKPKTKAKAKAKAKRKVRRAKRPRAKRSKKTRGAHGKAGRSATRGRRG